MKGFVVTLREDGLFEAPCVRPGSSSIRVIYDSYSPSSPWIALSLDDTGGKWARLDGFHCLDAAIDFAVRSALGEQMVPEYGVRMPDGTSFRRPGRIALEQVMASAGWLFVNSLVGFSMVTTGPEATVFDARGVMAERLKGSPAWLGDVNLADQDDEGLHWCADINLTYEGFVRVEDIDGEARAAFAAEGIQVIPHFDFRTRTSVSVSNASVIAFPEDRIVRRMTAA